MIPGAGVAYSVEGYNSFRRIGENTAGLAVVVGDHATALSMHFLAAQTDKVKSVTLGKQVQRIGYEIKRATPPITPRPLPPSLSATGTWSR